MPEPWVSVDEVAVHLGVAKDSVYRWIEAKGLPAKGRPRLSCGSPHSGRTRIGMDLADEEHFWKTSPGREAARLPLGRCLWGGAEADVARILVSEQKDCDFDGDAYVGLFHPRIS